VSTVTHKRAFACHPARLEHAPWAGAADRRPWTSRLRESCTPPAGRALGEEASQMARGPRPAPPRAAW